MSTPSNNGINGTPAPTPGQNNEFDHLVFNFGDNKQYTAPEPEIKVIKEETSGPKGMLNLGTLFGAEEKKEENNANQVVSGFAKSDFTNNEVITPAPVFVPTPPVVVPVQQIQAVPTAPIVTPVAVQVQATPPIQTQVVSPVVATPTPPPQVQVIPTTPVIIPVPVQVQTVPTTPIVSPNPVLQVQITPNNKVQGITPPPILIKKGSKVSPLSFALGCGFFGLLIVGLIAGLLYFAIQNPDQFQSVLSIDDIKTGLKLFGGLFFGIIFFVGFGSGIFNLYKLTTSKTGSKVGYVLGLLLSIIFVIGSAVGGTVAFNKINEIIGTTGSNSSLIIPMIAFKDGMKPISEGFPIIAPTSIQYGVNPELLKRLFAVNFATRTVNTLNLSCGNESKQILPYDSSQSNFIGTCLYTKKGSYPISLLVNSTDPATETRSDEVIDLGPLEVISEITITPSQGAIALNDAQDEIIIGKAPTKLTINSSKIFEDLKLPDYVIKRDFDNDGTFDSENNTNVTHQFRTARLQTIAYTLPNIAGYEGLVYLMTFRVQQSDVPICTLTADQDITPTQYMINASFDSTSNAITSYLYKVKDISTDRISTVASNSSPSLSYDFSKRGSYVVMLEYATDEGKRGYCETDTITVGASEFTPRYTLNFRGPNDNRRQSLLQSGAVRLEDDTIIVSSLPMRIQLVINSITPQTRQTSVNVIFDGKTILSPDNKTYEFTVTKPGEQDITIDINDPSIGSASKVILPIRIAEQDIIGKITIFPDTVGESPYGATLDATTITLSDKTDEIIYFSRDFGDGKSNPNTSQGRVTHTYIYDEKAQNGTYQPSVTITTKKGKKSTIRTTEPILVKKASIQAKISIDSHPAQIAVVGDQVTFSVQTDGLPTAIARDFGNNNPIECNDRSCATIPTMFDQAGKYTIKVTISYPDLSETSATTTLIVE